jgi:hypothetical protein
MRRLRSLRCKGMLLIDTRSVMDTYTSLITSFKTREADMDCICHLTCHLTKRGSQLYMTEVWT